MTIAHNGPIIIGSGLAGLSVALSAAPLSCLVVTPEKLGDASSTAWAQGGMASALGEGDTPLEHAKDTVLAGAGLVDTEAATILTQMGPATVRALQELGVPFDHNHEGGFSLGREAAHSMARIAKVGGDGAGRAIIDAVTRAAKQTPSITILENTKAKGLIKNDLGRIIGLWTQGPKGLEAIIGTHIVIATGGIGGLYAMTTNPPTLRGEGMGMAALAGAVICDPEMVQFHPTALNVGLDPAPLATEALRGEGAILIDSQGVRFCLEDHKDAELAPRDIVARAVQIAHLKRGGAFLDGREAIGVHFPSEFPFVFQACMSAGIDPRTELIPVAPAEHYHMGGIKTDLWGASSLEGLWAVGECASTGVHGANRLASNSLLEAAAFGHRVGLDLKSKSSSLSSLSSALVPPDFPALDQATLAQLRHMMDAYCAVVRDDEGLGIMIKHLKNLRINYPLEPSLISQELICYGALLRRESRGAHYRSDYPQSDQSAKHTLLTLGHDNDLAIA